MSWSIQVENLSKMYRMGDAVNPAMDGLYHVIEQSISRGVNALLGRKNNDESVHPLRRTGNNLVVSSNQIKDLPEGYFWALKDISFEIKEGDRVGIIGKNGSGKSTLLKILSRITTPTTGVFRFNGRLVSLLEVGTGFHPDLSGRENIMLNARINGMTGKAIKRVFDDIVDFSELGGQIETPIKRYSSGMYMRLAFAVAAHLESEILIVDEVLAVGDAAFQKKCIDKMLQISGSGRTLLFVSHDMDAVRKLCTGAMLFDHGRIVKPENEKTAHTAIEIVTSTPVAETTQTSLSSSADATAAYMSDGKSNKAEIIWQTSDAPTMDNCARIRAVRLLDANGNISCKFDVKDEITVEIEIEVMEKKLPVNAHIYLDDPINRQRIFFSMDNLVAPQEAREPGYYIERCKIYSPLLGEGTYTIETLICAGSENTNYATVTEQLRFQVSDDMKPEGVRGNWTRPWFQSAIRPGLEWKIEKK